MKNVNLFLVLMGSTLLIIFLYIWHHNTAIGYLYRKQRTEKQLVELTKEKERLTNELIATQNPHDIKKRAETLGMRQTPLANVQKLTIKQAVKERGS